MKTITVAIFDAEPINQYLSKKLLAAWKNADVTVFSSLEESVSTFKRQVFDFVFIDLNFQHTIMQGIVVLDELKKMSKKEFICIAVTPILLARDLKAALDAGFHYCIEQPITHEDLLQILSNPASEAPIAAAVNKDVSDKGIPVKKNLSQSHD